MKTLLSRDDILTYNFRIEGRPEEDLNLVERWIKHEMERPNEPNPYHEIGSLDLAGRSLIDEGIAKDAKEAQELLDESMI